MNALTPQLAELVQCWLDNDLDASEHDALAQLLAAAESGDTDAAAELADDFAGPLTFGTAGLRAAMGVGPNRMNRVVVSQAAAGFAAWLQQQGLSQVDGAPGVVLVGFDARHRSDVFARDTAEIMAGAGFRVLLTAVPSPTPVVAFGIRHFGAVAAVVVTASHNPAADNGYKVYLGDGSQIIPPTDTQIAEQIAAVAARPAVDLARSQDYTVLGDDLVSAYVDRAAALVGERDPRAVRWVYSAMHGVGSAVVRRVVSAIGFGAPVEVSAQAEPDPDFPTVGFPNPEEEGAMDLALELGLSEDADVVIVNDPDADRCAAAAVIDGRWRRLTGDELGALLGDDSIRRQHPGTLACSVVSSTLLGTMATDNGRTFTTTLTGFKWIGRVPDLAFGYEEAIGYCCDSRYVPDKDGITALVVLLRLVAELKAEGYTLADRLAQIDERYGIHATSQLSIRVEDVSLIASAMTRLRTDPPRELVGQAVSVRDLLTDTEGLPPTDAMEFTGPTIRVVVRPSGTEPKLKCYLEARVAAETTRADRLAARTKAEATLDRLRDQMNQVIGLAD